MYNLKVQYYKKQTLRIMETTARHNLMGGTPLNPIEIQSHAVNQASGKFNHNLAYMMKYSGRNILENLGRALDQTAQSAELLRCTVNSKLEFVELTSFIIHLEIYKELTPEEEKETFLQQVQTPFPKEGPLWKVLINYGEKETTIMFIFNQVITDIPSLHKPVESFWNCLLANKESYVPRPISHTIPPLESAFSLVKNQLCAFTASIMEDKYPARKSDYTTTIINAQTVERLDALCAKYETNMSSLIYAAFLKAEFEAKLETKGEPVNIVAITMTDCRSAYGISAEVMRHFSTGLVSMFKIADHTQLTELAKEIHTDVQNKLNAYEHVAKLEELNKYQQTNPSAEHHLARNKMFAGIPMFCLTYVDRTGEENLADEIYVITDTTPYCTDKGHEVLNIVRHNEALHITLCFIKDPTREEFKDVERQSENVLVKLNEILVRELEEV